VRLSLSWCERFTCFVTHRSPPMTVTGENTIARPRRAATKPRSLGLISTSRINSGTYPCRNKAHQGVSQVGVKAWLSVGRGSRAKLTQDSTERVGGRNSLETC
jgi:hypothetical protein